MSITAGAIIPTPQFSNSEKGSSLARPLYPSLGTVYLDTTLAPSGKPIFCVRERDPIGPVPAQWTDINGNPATVGIFGNANITQAPNTLIADGTVSLTIIGNTSITQAPNTLSATGFRGILGNANNTEAQDILSATGTLTAPIVGNANITEAQDTLSAAGLRGILGNANITEAQDTLSATGLRGIVGDANNTQAPETLSATGTVTSIIPIVTSVTPNTTAAYLGTTPLVIRGSNFTIAGIATSVTIGGIPCTSLVVIDDTEIHCVAGIYP